MKISRLTAGVGIVAVGALALSACTPPPRDSEIIEGTEIRVAWNDYYYAFNDGLADTNATSNAVVNYLVKSGFHYYDDSSELITNEDFGSYEVVSEDPFTVKYTINEGVTWSDGTPVDAADLLLTWIANTTHYQDGEGVIDEDEDSETFGDLTAQTGTFWNTGPIEGYALDLVSQVPEIGDDGRSVTLIYDEIYIDWALAFAMPPVSTHGTVQIAYDGDYEGEDGAQQAKEDFIQAVQERDLEWLAPVSETFNQDYKFQNTPDDPRLLISNGPYQIETIDRNGGYVTVVANEDYTWGPSPFYEKITVRVIPDAQAQLTALANGDVDIVSGQPTADIAQQLADGIPGVAYSGAPEGTYEHIDLQTGNGGPFDPATYDGDAETAKLVRQAFLTGIPRQQILDQLIKPLQDDAEFRNSQIFLPGTSGEERVVAETGVNEIDGTDIEGAQALLAEAGIDEPIDVRVVFAAANERRAQQFELMRQNLEQVGFNLVDVSDNDWVSMIFTQPNTYDAALFGWQSTSTAVGSAAANYQTGGGNNPFGWSNPEIDDLFVQLSRTPDPADQEDILVEVETLIFEEYWSIPIFQFPGITAWSENVEGVVPGFLSPTYFWNFWEWKPADAGAEG